MKQHYNKLIQTEINQLQRFKEQSERRNSSSDNIARFDTKIAELKQELEKEETPRYLKFIAEQKEMIRIQQKHQTEKQQLHQVDLENKLKLDAFYQQENKLRRDDRNLQYQMRREYEWLCKQDAKMPDYMKSALEKMPNNKGYIWKGIWYFGKLPSENPNLCIMFENNQGNRLIHEILKKRYHRIFMQQKHRPNELIYEKNISSKFHHSQTV